MSRRTLLVAAGLIVVGVGAFFLLHRSAPVPVAIAPQPAGPKSEVIGTSVQGRAITAYTYGTGAKDLLFVGGIHGGYEWNSVLLAYQFMDYLAANPNAVPAGISVTIIPSLNPDGVFKVTGVEGKFTAANVSTDKTILAAGRFNADAVDLNRNFDCKWQPQSMWQSKIVSAGTAAFSEPEARALRDFAVLHHPTAVVFWHSQSNAVYTSACGTSVATPTAVLADAYASASKYPKADSFTAYAITGDAGDWLSSIGIPAVAVELQTHETVEWERNLAGINALFTLYGQK